MKEAAIVIPIHKNILNSNEVVSLKRCFEAFAGWPVILAVPGHLDVVPFAAYGRFHQVVRFPDRFFASEKGYNTLLCRSLFYEQFRSFSHILIYQLDTFVFTNNLEEWCAAGYDYIGAPWLRSTWLEEWFARHRFFRLFRKRFNPVGNGGLSLRNVRSSLRACRRLRPFAGLFRHEDFFWSNVVPRLVRSFRTAPPDRALAFAFEEHPRELYALNGNRLPFGCHSWEKYGTDFWREQFRKYGYTI